MKRGRPVQSAIRQNIIDILQHLGEGYGYQISLLYNQIYPKCTMRSIHYHLKKGLETKEFIVKRVTKEKGKYSWGGMAEKIYYGLGDNAKPIMNERVKDFIDKKKALPF
ncbi:MAG: hypothetical protein WC254_00280 [Candidatus Woesearchaeota archaeon]|jgi:hypothetical protein